jgi:hypothetical protein
MACEIAHFPGLSRAETASIGTVALRKVVIRFRVILSKLPRPPHHDDIDYKAWCSNALALPYLPGYISHHQPSRPSGDGHGHAVDGDMIQRVMADFGRAYYGQFNRVETALLQPGWVTALVVATCMEELVSPPPSCCVRLWCCVPSDPILRALKQSALLDRHHQATELGQQFVQAVLHPFRPPSPRGK